MVSNEVGQPGFNRSGYTNVSTSDGIVHGQVKQSGAFSFVRIYESGHVSIVNVRILLLNQCPSLDARDASIRSYAAFKPRLLSRSFKRR